MTKNFCTPPLISLIFILAFVGCDQRNRQPAQTKQESLPQYQSDQSADNQQLERQYEFNSSDKSILSNGNMAVAAQRLRNMTPAEVWKSATPVSPSKITKSPYSSMGRLFRVTGSVYKVEEFPPTSSLSGQWTEVLMLVGNANSPLGVTTVDFIFNGDPEQLNSGTYITCAGCFVGTYETQNAYGGTIEALAIVGNVFKNQ